MSEVYRLEPMPSWGPTLVSVCASEVAIEPIEWLWPGRLAVGKHTCIAGEPGASKSQLTMDIAARISMASEWPCGEGNAPLGSTIILSAEDGAGDTIAPRLLASGADLGRIEIVTAVRELDWAAGAELVGASPLQLKFVQGLCAGLNQTRACKQAAVGSSNCVHGGGKRRSVMARDYSKDGSVPHAAPHLIP
jgi:hypothetical protein